MAVRPFPVHPGGPSSPKIGLSVRVSLDGLWLELNDGISYTVAEGSFEEQSVSYRRREAENPFLEGVHVVDSLRENVTEAVKVYVRGGDAWTTSQLVGRLKSAFGQQRFQVEVLDGNRRVLWNCYASDHSVQTSRPLRHARMALVKVELLRDPHEFESEEI